MNEFTEALCNDLNMPQAMAVVWSLVKSSEESARIARTLQYFDKVLALDLGSARTRLSDLAVIQGADEDKKANAETLAAQRLQFRKDKQFAEADRLRDEIKELGFDVKDTPSGFELKPLGTVSKE